MKNADEIKGLFEGSRPLPGRVPLGIGGLGIGAVAKGLGSGLSLDTQLKLLKDSIRANQMVHGIEI